MKQIQPTITVVIPTYNRSEMLKRAIKSVLKQTYINYEIIVVDDCSTDDTRDVILGYGHGRIRYFYNQTNNGGAYSRNVGIDNSKGKFIAFLDSDDEWLPTKLEKQIKCFENSPPEVGAVYTQIYEKGQIQKINPAPVKRGKVRKDLLQGWCPATTSAFMVKAEALKENIHFDEKLTSFQDYDLWIQLSQQWEFNYVPEPLVIFHHHDDSRLSKDLIPRLNGLDYILKKWHTNIVEIGGCQAVDAIRNKNTYSVYSHTVLNLLRNKKRMLALQMTAKLIETRIIKMSFWAKFIILFIGNETLINVAKRIRQRFE